MTIHAANHDTLNSAIEATGLPCGSASTALRHHRRANVLNHEGRCFWSAVGGSSTGWLADSVSLMDGGPGDLLPAHDSAAYFASTIFVNAVAVVFTLSILKSRLRPGGLEPAEAAIVSSRTPLKPL